MLSKIVGIVTGRPQSLGQGFKRVIRSTPNGKNAYLVSGGAGADRVYSNGITISLRDRNGYGGTTLRIPISDLSIGFEEGNHIRSLLIHYQKTGSELIRTVQGLIKKKINAQSCSGQLGFKNTSDNINRLNKAGVRHALSNII